MVLRGRGNARVLQSSLQSGGPACFSVVSALIPISTGHGQLAHSQSEIFIFIVHSLEVSFTTVQLKIQSWYSCRRPPSAVAMSASKFPCERSGVHVHGETAGGALRKILSDEELCDVELRGTDGIVVKANKTLLMVRSSYFRSIFLGMFSEASGGGVFNDNDASSSSSSVAMARPVSIGYPSQVLRVVVRFLCTDKLDLSLAGIDPKADPKDWENISSVLVAAASAGDYIGCLRLQKSAENEIVQMIQEPGGNGIVPAVHVLDNIISCCATDSLPSCFAAACRILADEVIGVAKRRVGHKLVTVGGDVEKLLDISPSALASIASFADADIKWDQEKIFRFISDWKRNEGSPDDRLQDARRACNELSLSRMSVKFLTDEVAPSGLVAATKLVVSLNEAKMTEDAAPRGSAEGPVLIVRGAGSDEVNGIYRPCEEKAEYNGTVYKKEGEWEGSEVIFYIFQYIIDRQGVDSWALVCLSRDDRSVFGDSRDVYHDYSVPFFYFLPYTDGGLDIGTTTERWIDSDPHERYDEGGDGNGDELRRTKHANPSFELCRDWLCRPPKPVGRYPGPAVVLYDKVSVLQVDPDAAEPQKKKGRME